MAWLGIIIIIFYMDMQDQAIYRVWIHFFPTYLYPRREEKHLVWAGIELQVLLLYKRQLKPLDHGSCGIVVLWHCGTAESTTVCSQFQTVPDCLALNGR